MSSVHQQYEIIIKKQFCIFQPSWTAYQELLLLKSIEKWGFGNWNEIKQYMEYFGSKFEAGQIEIHYNTFYLSNNNLQPQFSQNNLKKLHIQEQNIYKINKGKNPVSLASLGTNLSYSKLQNFQQVQDFSNYHEQFSDCKDFRQIQHSKQKNQKIQGYNNKRKQFQVQFDQHAQNSLANLQFRDDDLPQQTQIKFILLQQYNKRIQKRHQVSHFVIQHKLLDLQYQKEIENTRTQYQKLAANQLKKFMRFNSFNTHNQLIKRLALQKQLKSVIQGLRCLRKDPKVIKIKDILEKIRQQSIQKMIKRGRPRKVIHLDKQYKNIKQDQNQDQLIQKLGICMKDVQNIVKKSQNKKNGETLRYKNVKINILQKG